MQLVELFAATTVVLSTYWVIRSVIEKIVQKVSQSQSINVSQYHEDGCQQNSGVQGIQSKSQLNTNHQSNISQSSEAIPTISDSADIVEKQNQPYETEKNEITKNCEGKLLLNSQLEQQLIRPNNLYQSQLGDQKQNNEKRQSADGINISNKHPTIEPLKQDHKQSVEAPQHQNMMYMQQQNEKIKTDMQIKVNTLQSEVEFLNLQNRQQKQRIQYLEVDLMKQIEKASSDYSSINQQLELLKLKQQDNSEYNQLQIPQNMHINQKQGTQIAQLRLQNQSYHTQIQDLLVDRQKLQNDNENLRNQLHFCQQQLSQFYEYEKTLQDEIRRIKQMLNIKQATVQSVQPAQLLDKKINNMSPIPQRCTHNSDIQISNSENNDSRVRKNSRNGNHIKINGTHQNTKYVSQLNMEQQNQKSPVNTHPKSIRSSKSGILQKQAQTPVNNFLSHCSFLSIHHRQFVYATLQKIFMGTLSTRKIYSSGNPAADIHSIIDNVPCILLIIQLKNQKILGAFTQQPFNSDTPHSTVNNISFILDISSFKYFACQSGQNSISYSKDALIWGYNQIMLKNQEQDVMYTNFCRRHNIYWDGKYSIEDFIGVNRQWARIQGYQIHQVYKL